MKKKSLFVVLLAVFFAGIINSANAGAATSVSYEEAVSLCSRWGGSMDIKNRKCSQGYASGANPTINANCSKYGGTGYIDQYSESCTWSTLKPATASSASTICSTLGGSWSSSDGRCSATQQSGAKVQTYCSSFGGASSNDANNQNCTWNTLGAGRVTSAVGSASDITYEEAKNLCINRWGGSFNILERKCTASQYSDAKVLVNCTNYGGQQKSSQSEQGCVWSKLRPTTSTSASAICAAAGGSYVASTGVCNGSHQEGDKVGTSCSGFGGVNTSDSYSQVCTWAALGTSRMPKPNTGNNGGGSGGGSGGGNNGGDNGGNNGGGSGGGSRSDYTGSADSNTDICNSYKELMSKEGQYEKYKSLYDTYCGDEKDETDATKTVKRILSTVFTWMGIVAVIVIILGGVFYMTSEGDPAKITKAKNTILYAVIGLIVALLSFAIVNFVLKGMNQ